MRGHATRVAYAKTAPTTKALEFLSSSISEKKSLIGGDGSETRRGRSRHEAHKTSGLISVGGTLTLEPRPDDLDLLLELICGTAIAADVVALAETVPAFYVDQQYGSVDAIRFESGKVSRATFSSRQGGKLTLAMDCAFLDYDDTITYPSLEATFSEKIPYAHHNGVLTIGGTAYQSPEFDLTIDNMIGTDTYENSNTLVELMEGDRAVSLRISPLLSSAVKSAFGDALLDGVAGSLVYTLGGDSLTFAFACMQLPLEGAELGGKNADVRRGLVFDCVEVTATKELICTNVSA